MSLQRISAAEPAESILDAYHKDGFSSIWGWRRNRRRLGTRPRGESAPRQSTWRWKRRMSVAARIPPAQEWLGSCPE